MRKLAILSVLFILIFAILLHPVSAAVSDVFLSPYEEACTLSLYNMNILSGYTDSTFKPQNFLTRAEFVALIVRVMGTEQEYTTYFCPFLDVNESNWFYKYVCISYDKKYVEGYADNSFRPAETITYAEAVSILIRLLGYDNNLSGVWPGKYLDKAASVGLINNIHLAPNTQLKRGEAFILICDALMVKLP